MFLKLIQHLLFFSGILARVTMVSLNLMVALSAKIPMNVPFKTVDVTVSVSMYSVHSSALAGKVS